MHFSYNKKLYDIFWSGRVGVETKNITSNNITNIRMSSSQIKLF